MSGRKAAAERGVKAVSTIRARLLLVAAALLLPVAALLSYQSYRDFSDGRKAAGTAAVRAAEVTAAGVSRFLGDTETALASLARRPRVRALDPRQCDPALGDYLDSHPYFANVLTLDLAARVVCSVAAIPPDARTVPRDIWMDRLVQSGQFTLGGPYRGPITGKWIVALAYPLRDARGEIHGALGLQVDLVHFPFAAGKTASSGTDIRIVTGDGIVIASLANPDAEVGRDMRGRGIADIVLARKQGVAEVAGADGVERIYGFLPVPGTGWYAYAGVPARIALEGAAGRTLWSVVSASLVMLLAVGIAAYAARAVARPIEAAEGTARRLAHGDRDARFESGGAGELAELLVQFNRTLDALADDERERRRSEKRLSDVVASVAEGIVSIDERQRIVMFNPGAERMFARSAAEMIGQPLDRLIPDRFRARHAEQIRGFAASGQTRRRMGEYGMVRGLRASGEEFPIEAAVSRSGAPPEGLTTVILRDVTERMRAEAERERLLRVIEASLNEIYLFDPGTLRFRYANPAALRNLGYGAEEMRALTPVDLKPEFDVVSFRTLIAPLLHGERDRIVFQTDHQRADGSRYPVEVHLQIMGGGEEREFVAVIFDITARRLAEQALRDYAGRLRLLSHRLFEAKEDERRRLARELHDRVGPDLTALSLNLKILRGEVSADALGQANARLDDCEAILDQTALLVRDVLVDLRPPGLDELGLAAALAEHARQAAGRGGFSATVSGGERMPRLPAATEITLFRIAQEALTNVARHAHATEVAFALESGPDAVVLTIADNGRGFDTEAPLKEPRASLGLVNMRERAESIGGRLRVESAPGQGTRVIVEAPRGRRGAA